MFLHNAHPLHTYSSVFRLVREKATKRSSIIAVTRNKSIDVDRVLALLLPKERNPDAGLWGDSVVTSDEPPKSSMSVELSQLTSSKNLAQVDEELLSTEPGPPNNSSESQSLPPSTGNVSLQSFFLRDGF